MVWPAIAAAAVTAAASLYNQRRQEKKQEQFAKQGVQWRAADARAAGLSPLAAQGMGASYSPVMGVDFGAMSQNLARAYSANSDQDGRDVLGEFMAKQLERQDARDAAARREERELRKHELELQILQSRLALANQPGSGPPVPSVVDFAGPVPVRLGGGYAAPGSVRPEGVVKIVAPEVLSRQVGDSGLTAGSSPTFSRVDIGNGSSVELVSSKVAEQLEPYGLPGVVALHGLREWNKFRHGIAKPNDDLLPKGYRWEWSVWNQSWSPVKK